MTKILANVIRGETIESVHRGNIAVIDGEGKTIKSFGDPHGITFWRSAAKSIQAIPLITSGAADAFGFDQKEIALSCASHSAQEFHTETANRMLAKIGLSESDLRCGVHRPIHCETADELIRTKQEPTQIHNNCSGKHAGMLAIAKHIGADRVSYLEAENPVQQAILESVSRFSEIAIDEIKLGIDGCSAPNFALPISGMAKAFLKLVNPESAFSHAAELVKACQELVSAQIEHPEYVGGSGRLDTEIMGALRGKAISKVGAEGVWCAGILPSEKWKSGLGIALKIEDGDDGNTRSVVAVELLRQLDLLDEDAEKRLAKFSPFVLTNCNNRIVGEIIADF